MSSALTLSEQATNAATREHIQRVGYWLGQVTLSCLKRYLKGKAYWAKRMPVHLLDDRMIRIVGELEKRRMAHDQSKLEQPEVEVFTEFTPLLKGCTFGSDKYKGFLAAMKPALDHHYAQNDHHPEHFEDGIGAMDLFQLTEMLCDWKAASERHADGDILRSLDVNQERFGMTSHHWSVLYVTAKDLGMVKELPANDEPGLTGRSLMDLLLFHGYDFTEEEKRHLGGVMAPFPGFQQVIDRTFRERL